MSMSRSPFAKADGRGDHQTVEAQGAEEMGHEVVGALHRLSRDRVVAVWQSDLDLLHDAAGPLAHHQDPIGHGDGFRQIVGDEKRGQTRGGNGCGEAFLQDQFGLRVERGKRFVEQQDAGVDRQRAGQRGALPLATGELIRVAIGQFGKAAAPQFA
jgi:hypothetical protein